MSEFKLDVKEEGDVVGDADTSEVKDKFKEMQDMAV